MYLRLLDPLRLYLFILLNYVHILDDYCSFTSSATDNSSELIRHVFQTGG